jgi:AraC-like DNA-binding protein
MPKPLPLVQLRVLRPIVQALREHGVDPEFVLESVGLTGAAIDDEEATVHVMVVHQFAEECARAIGDQTFLARVGSRLDPSGWPMIADARTRAETLGDFLNIYVSGASQVASSVTAYLEVRGNIANFGEARVFRPTIVPAQNDGFMISLALSILEHALGDRTDPSKMLIIVCDPSVLPDRFKLFQVLRGDRMGFRIQFPSVWLTLSMDSQAAKPKGSEQSAPQADSDFLPGFRSLLRRHIGDGGLTAEKTAQLVCMSRWKLARFLASIGTDISSEIKRARLDFAKEQLGSTDRSIEDISAALGYADPSNFSRAFSKAIGVTPSKFRRNGVKQVH